MPDALFRLLAHDGSTWDAPLQGDARGDAALPTADTLDLRALPGTPLSRNERAQLHAPAVVGSNNFAVAGAHASGRALVADDMHLGLRAPALWFRARLQYADAQAPGGRVDVSGFSLPGLPVIVVGSNTHVAWGFTNSYGDWLDWVRVPADARADAIVETIAVKGEDAQTLTVHETAWGPILHTQADGTRLALLWTAHRAGALDLGLMRLNQAGDLDAAVVIARTAGMPVQNMLVGDASGRIAWVPAGRIPKRVGDCDPRFPIDPAQGCDWNGWLDASELTDVAVIDPDDGRLWTANARVADANALRVIGDGGYDLGARQQQIRDVLHAREHFSEADLLALQLDDRALFLERWWTLLRATVADSDDPALQRIATATKTWSGHASIDSVSYRLARGFRERVIESIAAGLLAPAKARLGDDFIAPSLTQFEGVAWPLLQQRPPHLLPPPHASWDALLTDAARSLKKSLASQGADLADRTWGERNTAAICHPLAGALPGFLRRPLCMPPDALAGDSHMPRVAAPAFGASQRMVVSPGHEADGIVQMPGGQSGHPLSPFWGAGHAAWVQGDPTPFLPGEAQHTLVLKP